MIAGINVLPLDSLFKYRIIYQLIIAIQEIFLLLFCLLKSTMLQHKIAGLLISFSLTLRIALSGIIIKEQCQNNQRKYSGSNDDHLNSKSGSLDKNSPNQEKWKISPQGGGDTPQRTQQHWKQAVKQLAVLSPQIVAKLSLFNAMMQTQNSALILFLNYFYDDKTFLLVGAKRLLSINQLIINMLIKFFPFAMVLMVYLKDNSKFNSGNSYSIHTDDLVWIGIMVFSYFFSDQFYHSVCQKIEKNGLIVKSMEENNKQNPIGIADSFINFCQSKYQNQCDLIQGINNNTNNNNQLKLSINATNSQILQVSNHNNRQGSPQKKSVILKKNISNSRSGITENIGDQQNAKSFESSIDDIQDSLFFQDLIGLVPQGIAILNSKHKILYHNSKILELLECDRENVFKVITSLSTQMNPGNNISSNNLNGQYSLKPSNTLIHQPSYNNARHSVSQFASRKYNESSIENILTQPFGNDEYQMSKNSQLHNDNQMANSVNLPPASSSIKNFGNNSNYANLPNNHNFIQSSNGNTNYNLNSTIQNSNRNKQHSQLNDAGIQENSQIFMDKLKNDSIIEGDNQQTFNFEKSKMQSNNQSDDLKENDLESLRSPQESQNRSHSIGSPQQSQKSQDFYDQKYKQSTGKFGGSNTEMPLDNPNGNMRLSFGKEQYIKEIANLPFLQSKIGSNRQPTLDSKNKIMSSLTFQNNHHLKHNNAPNGTSTKQNSSSANINLVNKKCESEYQKYSSKDDSNFQFVISEKQNLHDMQSFSGQNKLYEETQRKAIQESQFQSCQKEQKMLDEGAQMLDESKYNLQSAHNKSQDIIVSDISRLDDNKNPSESISYLKSNQLTVQNLEDIVNHNNLDMSKIDQEQHIDDNHITQSDNQFVSFQYQDKSSNSNINGLKHLEDSKQFLENKVNKSKFAKKLPSSTNIQTTMGGVNANHPNRIYETQPNQADNSYQIQGDENHHTHILKKEIKKQISIFTPQLKQRNIKVGQLISNMFDNQMDDTRTYGGVKKSSSKNHLITQLSEPFESNYSRNHSLLGQINGNKNIGFYQYKNNEASMQVLYKGKSLVVRLIPCEFQYDFEDNDSPPTEDQSLVLIQVEPFWEELFQARQEDFSKQKMQLFGSLCHELRTPLNCSISFLDLYRQLKDGSEDEADINEFIEPSLRSNQLMLNMVNDILDFVQMADNKFKFNPIPFNLIELLEECLVLIKVHADIKNINLQLKKNDLVPKFIVSDPNRIRQIILNFLSNSLKFTKNFGTIQIEAYGLDSTIIPSTKLSSIIRVAVNDTGIGISKQNQRKIFEVFNKTDHKDSSINPNGCGIGLPLSNSLAKLIGPQQSVILNQPNGVQTHISSGIQVESVEGKGSTFSFIIQDLNGKLFQEKDLLESCEISEYGDNDQVQSQQDSNPWKSPSPVGQHIPHLHIKQEVAGGLQMYHFQQANQTPFQYLTDSFTDTRIKTIQSSALRSSNRTNNNNNNDISSSGAFERIPSNTLNKPRRITDGFKKTTTTEYEQSLSKLQMQSIPKIQSQQVFSFPASSNFAPIQESSGHNSPINIVKYHAINSPMNSNQNMDFKTEVKSLMISNQNNNLSSFPQIRAMNSASMQSQITGNTQDLDIQSLKYQTPGPVQQLQSALNPTQIPSQTFLVQQCSIGGQKPPQNQLQKNLLDKNLNFSVNYRGEDTKILIVDDSGFNIMVLKKIIQLFHIQNINICHDGQEAVAKVRDILNDQKERLYDIIFMDLDMPIMNGYEACKQIKQMLNNYEISESLYIVACSAYGMQVKEEHTFHISQLDDAIIKPIKKDQVQHIFQTFLRDKPKPL